MSFLSRHSTAAYLLRRPKTFFTAPCNVRQRLYQDALPRLTCRRNASTFTDPAGMIAHIPMTFLNTLHATGLPWWAVIPLSAFLVRTFIVLPFFQIPRRRDIAKMQLLRPLLDARMSLYQRYTLRKSPHRGWAKHRLNTLKQRIWYGNYIANYWGIHNRFIKRFGGFLVLVIVTDGLRRLCGAKEGLLGLFFKPWERGIDAYREFVTSYVRAAVSKIDEWRFAMTGERVVHSKEVQEWLDEKWTGEETEEQSAKERRLRQMEPSLQTEGLFFCKDLTKRDETMILPVLFVGSFAASIIFAPRADPSGPDEENTPAWNQKSPDELILAGKLDQFYNPVDDMKRVGEKQGLLSRLTSGLTNLQRIFLTFSVFLTLPALQMPSALLIYFISSINLGILQTRMLARAIPIRLAPGACRRPVRTTPWRIRDAEK